jgi:hypothetical protein
MIINKLIIRYKLSLISFFITGLLLTVVQLKVSNPMLLAERFFPGMGWIEIAVLSVYAGFVLHKMTDIAQTSRWRKNARLTVNMMH